MHSVVVLCNPLLDKTGEASSKFICSLGYEVSGAYLLDAEKSQALEKNYKHEYPTTNLDHSPGGSGLNTARVLKQLSKEAKDDVDVRFVGSLAGDEDGQLLQKSCADIGLKTFFQVHKESTEHTGTCLTFVTDHERTLLTHLGAARHLSRAHIESVRKEIEGAEALYVTAFAVSDAYDATTRALELSQMVFCNIASVYIATEFNDRVHHLIEKASLVFGNHDEMAAYLYTRGSISNKDISTEELALVAAKTMKAQCVITDGGKCVVGTCEGTTVSVPPVPLPREKIVNTNGAGDAFVGGFILKMCELAGDKPLQSILPLDKSAMAACIQVGSSASARVLVSEGTSLTELIG